MCAITGISSWDRAVDRTVLEAMTAGLVPREPDRSGVWTRLREFIRSAAVAQLWREHDARLRDHGLKLYGLLCLAL